MDTWKVENGKITEHWDAVQPIDGFMRFYFWMKPTASIIGGAFFSSWLRVPDVADFPI